MLRAGHTRDEESHRGELHPRSEIRNQEPEPKQPKVPVAQRRYRIDAASGSRSACSHGSDE